MDGIERDKRVSVLHCNVDDNEVMDMIKIVTDALCCNVWVYTADDKIASGATNDFTSNMPRKDKLAFVPLYFDLKLSFSIWMAV